MPEPAATIKITKESLDHTAVKYEKNFVKLPFIALSSYLANMTGMPGVRGSVVLSEMKLKAQYAPYNRKRKETDPVEIIQRSLTTYLGSSILDIDPNEMAMEVYGSLITQGEDLKNVDISKEVLTNILIELGENLGMAAFKMKRNPQGTTSMELGDGWDTIADAEILARNITTEKGNLYEFSQTITAANADDLLKAFYRKASKELRAQPTILYMDNDTYDAYCDAYQANHGALPYNTEFDKVFLEGSHGKCRLCPMEAKNGSKYLQLAPAGNLIYGYGRDLNRKIEIKEYEPFLLTFLSTCFFGTQYKSIDPKFLLIGKLHQEP